MAPFKMQVIQHKTMRRRAAITARRTCWRHW